MYNPLKYKSFEELLGTIEVDRVALSDGQGQYLQHGEFWDADLSQGNAQTWSAAKDNALDLKIAELDAKGDVAVVEPLYVWADKVLPQSRFESVEKFADYLIKDGLAVVYNYTPAEDEPEVEPGDTPEEPGDTPEEPGDTPEEPGDEPEETEEE